MVLIPWQRESALWTTHSQGEGETHSIVYDNVYKDARMWGGEGLACLTRTDDPASSVPALPKHRVAGRSGVPSGMLRSISIVLTDLCDFLPPFLLYSLPVCQEASLPHFISSPPRVTMRWLFALILYRTVVYTCMCKVAHALAAEASVSAHVEHLATVLLLAQCCGGTVQLTNVVSCSLF